MTENPYTQLLHNGGICFSLPSIAKGLVGMAAIILVCWIFSSDRKHINWGTVGKALLLQLAIAISVLALPAVQTIFETLGSAFIAVLDWTKAGSNFLFGSLMDSSRFGFVFVFQILPTIVFFSALMSLFFYLGIMQKIVWVMGWLLTKFMKLSGAEALSCAGNVFLGQSEAPLMVKEYVPNMTKSELVVIMTSGMATMSGGVLAAYIGMLGQGDPVLELEFAKHLLSASVMAAPGAIALSKILVPQTEEIDNSLNVSKEKIGKNVLDAVSNGTADGLKMAANIAALLLVFYALIAGANEILGWLGLPSLERILAIVFYPVIWLTGAPGEDIGLIGRLLGEKLILTEFIGYQSMAQMVANGAFSSPKSVIMASYVLCGFANFASVGILIGAVGGMAPNKKHILAQYGFKALLGSALVALMSAAMIGMFM
jgi:CNT family concentrative nucleoside transporter